MELLGRQPNFQQNHPGVDTLCASWGWFKFTRWYFWGSKTAWLWLKHVVPRDPFGAVVSTTWNHLMTNINHVQLIGSVFTGVPNAFSYLGTSTCWSLKGWMPRMPSSTNSCQTRIAVSWLPKPSEVLVSPVLQMVHGKIGMGVIVAIVMPWSWMGFQL
jgi:hypothetical protein